MPVFHFTFHAYGTWLPDKPKGFVRRKQGVLVPDRALANTYRSQMAEAPARFEPTHQCALHDMLRRGQSPQRYRLLAVAAETTHLHAVLAWRDARDAKAVRTIVKSSLTRNLNQCFGKRTWFVRNASQKHVADPEHLAHLLHHYLPSHRGLFWREGMDSPSACRADVAHQGD